jgi:hypothetical protein
MTELVMLEAALFQLRAAVDQISDDFFSSQLRLAVNVLAGAIAAASESTSAAKVNDVEFALNDVSGLMNELGASDADLLAPALAMMQEDIDRLKQETALAPAVITAIRALQVKLKTRRAAIERETFRDPSTPAQPLPHPPEELKNDALPLREQLVTSGFETPALDALIADPASLRFATISEINDELDVIAG